MTFGEQLRLVKRIDYLIRSKATGSPKDLSNRLEVSKATTHRYLNELRNLGAEINYCKLRKSYYYEAPFKLKF